MLFEAYLDCPTKCFLLSIGEESTENTYANWKDKWSQSYHREGIRRLIAEHSAPLISLEQVYCFIFIKRGCFAIMLSFHVARMKRSVIRDVRRPSSHCASMLHDCYVGYYCLDALIMLLFL